MENIKTKEEARQFAIDWQQRQSEKNLSYSELAKWQSYLSKIAEVFDLTDEFKENGII